MQKQTLRTLRTSIIFTAIVLFGFFCFAKSSEAADTLLQSDSMTYLGAFTVQNYSYTGCSSYSSSGYCPEQTSYGGSAIGFNPNGNGGVGSLFINGFNNRGTYIGEINIPDTFYAGTDPASLPQAQLLNGVPHFWDISEGHFTNVGLAGSAVSCENGWGVGGILPVGNSILATSYCYYLAGEDRSYVPFILHNSSDLSLTGVFDGMHGLNPSVIGNGETGDFQSGALGNIPSAYQQQLGGKILVGANSTGMSIVSRTSYGPSIIAFDPNDFGDANSVFPTTNANTLATYNQAHQTLGSWSTDANEYYSMADHYGALIFPEGSRTILVAGIHGSGGPGYACPGRPLTGVPCYGIPTDDCTLGAQDGYCYDPTCVGCVHQNTAWPYSNYVWAYDVGDADGNNTNGNNVQSANSIHPEKNNLTAAKLGQVNPWDLKPYAVWPLPDSDNLLSYNFGGGRSRFASGTYDPATGRAYFIVRGANLVGCCSYLPVIEVYQITAGSGEINTIAPTSPSGLNVS